MEPKDIERLFQEKLKDLEMTPNPAVWNKIKQSMTTPKKSRKRFIWLFSGSVAALLVLSFFLFNNTDKHPEVAFKKKIKKEVDSTFTTKDNFKKDVTPTVANNNNINKKENTKNINTVSPKKKTPIYVATNTDKRTKNTAFKNTPSNTAIAATENIKANKNVNTSSNNTSQKRPLIDIAKKQDLAAVVKKETPNITNHKKHWSIAPVVSELFYNTLSNKSPVDSRLDNAAKNGESSTSFGLKIAYQASKKWRIQTGIHQISMAQTTKNVAVASISRNSSFTNSSQALSSPTINNSSNEITLTNLPSTDNELRQLNNSNNQLRQSFGYIEIPIEVNYQLFETNKLQFHLVGGLSSLFLTNNNLQIENPNYSYSDGEATNLNEVNFSFNLGTAVEYHFSNSWFFNLSPMLKMQTQTFSNTNNKPYLLGVSTGLNYKF
ncbi:porin family protein [Wenyingzhuangia sp. chi5]|uniref:Porin family protein n=1 Tax=Wenyingzhuangia gilva TaxID=3057677 RepID=A0ABT8VPL3_9FLAO|nr:porin family protein [Wenyingzhuangia sp. chi5]MDO3693920.1 porin family protein [Wenyingzhuangia sp. chi5]